MVESGSQAINYGREVMTLSGGFDTPTLLNLLLVILLGVILYNTVAAVTNRKKKKILDRMINAIIIGHNSRVAAQDDYIEECEEEGKTDDGQIENEDNDENNRFYYNV